MTPFSVVHTIPGLKQAAGGVSRSVPSLCVALAEQGCSTMLVSQRDRNTPRDTPMLPNPKLVPTRLIEGYDWEGLRVSFTPGLGRALAAACGDAAPCLVHDHGIWLHMNHVAAQVTGRLGLKRIVSPRGMLDGWSLKYRGWKKKVAWAAYQHHDLVSATAFSATSTHEAESIRLLGFQQPVAVIPNGIDLPALNDCTANVNGPRTVLFMSRIHPKKGLPDLVAAWGRIDRAGWRLVIAGPDEAGHREQIEASVHSAGLAESVSFVNAVEGEAKHALLSSADLFVLPSYSENFGIVVGEALSYGIPVITTNVTPWAELHSRDCGWWIDIGPQALAQALTEALALSDDQRRAMGRRGHELIGARYSWRSAAEQHVELYRWLLGASDKPMCLID